MELACREALARTDETRKLEADIAWLKEVPVAELIEREYITPTRDKSLLVRQLLEFFGVSSVDDCAQAGAASAKKTTPRIENAALTWSRAELEDSSGHGWS